MPPIHSKYKILELLWKCSPKRYGNAQRKCTLTFKEAGRQVFYFIDRIWGCRKCVYTGRNCRRENTCGCLVLMQRSWKRSAGAVYRLCGFSESSLYRAAQECFPLYTRCSRSQEYKPGVTNKHIYGLRVHCPLLTRLIITDICGIPFTRKSCLYRVFFRQ